jgi:hypothetical protein
MESFFYVVKFDVGYYAEYQPDYEWAFTDDIMKAKLYKNIVHCNNLIRRTCSYDVSTHTAEAVTYKNPIILKVKKIEVLDIVEPIEPRPFKYKCNYTFKKN